MHTVWYLIIGALLIFMALAGALLKRLPVSTGLLYLLIGLGLGPLGAGLLDIDPLKHSRALESITQAAVLISLFTAGLKLRAPLKHGAWRRPQQLAVNAMLATILLLTLVGVFALGLPLGAAILLGAALHPTDPVLASEVQLRDSEDRNRVRFSLTAEGGLNDGMAFPFVMLGLGLLGLHELGAYGERWVAIDLIWAVAAGLGIGWLVRAGGRTSGDLLTSRASDCAWAGRISGVGPDSLGIRPSAAGSKLRLSRGIRGRTLPCAV